MTYDLVFFNDLILGGEQGRAQEFERGGKRSLKPSVFRPKSSEE